MRTGNALGLADSRVWNAGFSSGESSEHPKTTFRVASLNVGSLKIFFPLPGGRSRGRPAKTWSSCVEKDMESYDLENADPLNRAEWRKCIS